MFVLFPTHTDVVARGFPYGTVGILAANLAVALAGGFVGEGTWVDGWALELGTLAPLQWVTNVFAHGGWGHLIGNLIFLWVFGFVVEATLGWRHFLELFLVLAVAEGLLTQVVLMGAEGSVCGASGVVYGLMAIAALWSPRNTIYVQLAGLWAVRMWEAWEVPVVRMCAFWIGLDVLVLLLSGFPVSSAMFHVLGASLGLAAGLALLRLRWVDLEGWDYLSLRRYGTPRRRERGAGGRHAQGPGGAGPETSASSASGAAAPRRLGDVTPSSPSPAAPPPADPRVETLVAVRDALDAGRPVLAEEAYARLLARRPEFRLPPDDLAALARALLEHGAMDDAPRRIEELAAARREAAAALRLDLAEALVDEGRPRRARRHLDAVDEVTRARLPDPVRARWEALAERARKAPGGRSGLELE